MPNGVTPSVTLSTIALLVVAGLLLTGCGSDDSGTAAPGSFGGAGAGGSTSGGSAGLGGGGAATGGTSTGGSGWPGGGAGGDAGASGASGASGAGGAAGASSDPCADASDGPHCGGELGAGADHGSLYDCAADTTRSVSACANGCAADSCTSPPSDPCESAQSGDGAYCGAGLSGGDVDTLYDCQSGASAGTTACPAGCQVNPPGIADKCAPTGGDPCVAASAGSGAYCGSSLGGGDSNVLYTCSGQTTSASVTCPNGCQQNPPGVADACAPTTGGQCCLNRPPGALTQSYSACGNGGSHYGVDHGAPIGTPIYAGMSGSVDRVRLGFPNCYDNGCDSACWNAFNYVRIKSDCGDPSNAANDLYVYYLHISAVAPGISEGQHVEQGALLANVGNSGCSSGPHVHVETISVPRGQQPSSLNTCSSKNPAGLYCN